MVLVGEPGAGKTTLAKAAARLAAAAGVTATWGRCLDAASTPAYWPWSQVLRALPDGPLVRAARQRLDGEVAGEGDDSARQFQAYQAVAAARLDQPDHPSIPHLAAPAAALGFTQRGDIERARQITTRWFAPPPRSWTWIQPIAYWAQVATALGVPDPAWLYDQLAPHAGELAIVGVAGDGGGAVDSLLAGLAWRLGRPGEATERAQVGLALETRVGSRIWINRTKDLINRIGTAQSSQSS